MNKRIVMMLMGAITLLGCSKQENTNPENATPLVYTVNYPLAFFAERIAGDRVEIVFPEMEGDPAFWNPPAEQIAAYQQADMILLNGAGYARWVQQASLPPAKLINTSKACSDQYIFIDGAAAHSHGGGEKHAHGEPAFTIWLDPQLALQQADAIRDVFSIRWSEHAAEFDTNFEILEQDLNDLDAALKTAFAALNGAPLVGSHPVYQYLARRYSLNLKSVHWEPDALPDQAMVRNLDDLLEAHAAKIMLWEGEPLEAIELMVEEKGLQTLVFDPCGNRPEEGDYFSIMQTNLKNVKMH